MRLLRATILPLLALFSLATLAWGVVSWWTFYRDLYLEEELALQALADEVGGVWYRRVGDFERLGRSREAATPGEIAAIDVPWSVPFAGRVEYVDANAYDRMGYAQNLKPSSQPVRDRVLRLPGLRGYHDVAQNRIAAKGMPAKEVPLGRPLPAPPKAKLFELSLEAAILGGFPSGDEVDAAERRSLAEAIAENWTAERPNRPRLVRRIATPTRFGFASTPYDELFLVDGERRLRIAIESPAAGNLGGDRSSNAVLLDDEALWEFRSDGTKKETRSFARLGLPEATLPEFWSPTALRASAETGYEPEELIGDSGEKIVRIGRLDSRRLTIETLDRRQGESNPWKRRFRAVVREDLDYAIERWDYASGYAYDQSEEPPLKLRNVEIRRLERIDGEPCIVESFHERFVDVGHGMDDLRERTRTRVAVEFDPVYSSAALEASSYVSDLPEPRELPVVRGYRIAWIAGGVGSLFAGVGFLIQALGRRVLRTRDVSSGTRRVRLRFGLASVIATTLLVIGVAGWIKERIDETEEESALLRSLLDEHSVDFQRSPPTFPWLLVSTDSFPIGAPLASIELLSSPKPELLDRILERSPPIRVAIDEYDDNDLETTEELAADALGEALPEFADVDPPSREEIERGDPLPEEEAKRLFDEARGAWSEAPAKRPERFLLRVESTLREQGGEIAIRDGERHWDLRGCEIRCFDGRFHRRFVKAWDHDDWVTVGRQDADEPFLGQQNDYPQPPAARDEREFDETEAPAEFPVAPFALPNDLSAYWTRFERALERDEAAIAVEKLDENRFLLEVARTYEEGGDPELPQSIRWTLVARRDLDWCVEACDFVETLVTEDGLFSTLANDPFASPGPGYDGVQQRLRTVTNVPILIEYERTIRCRTTLRRIGDQIVPVEMRLALLDGPTDIDPKLRPESLRLALDLDPEIDQRLFDRPTLDSPDPVVPREKSSFRWYVVALLFGVAVFAIEPLRTLGKRLTPASSKRAALPIDDSGKDSA